MWELDFWRDIGGIGLGTAVVLFAAHFALDHWRATFLAHPPRAYTVGVSILFAGYSVWAALHPAPLPPLVTVLALAGITGSAGTGTWAAWTLQSYQRRRARAASRAA